MESSQGRCATGRHLFNTIPHIRRTSSLEKIAVTSIIQSMTLSTTPAPLQIRRPGVVPDKNG
jgi:hypothetical protein